MPESSLTPRQTVTRTILVFFTIIAFLSTILAPLAARAADPDPSVSPDVAQTEAPASESPAPTPSDGPVAAPTIQSDLQDYPPGGLVTLAGTNWRPGESVHIFVNDDWGSTWSRNVDVSADDAGMITDQFTLPNWFVATYSVTAEGPESGTARSSFTDSNPQSVSVAAPTSRTVTAGSTANYGDMTIVKGGNNNSCTIELSVASGIGTGLPAGTTLGPSSLTMTTANVVSPVSVSTTTSTAAGTYTFAIHGANSPATPGCQGPGPGNSNTLTLVVNAGDTTVNQPTLTSPANGTVTTDTTPTFDWTTVTDPSNPVTYTLQYVVKGATCSFASPTSVTGLSSSDYTPGSSIGADSTYCWRVEAIDGLGNHSGFTSAFEFPLDTAAGKPTLSVPANNAITSDNTPAFDWSDVSDPSTPVSYTLQYVTRSGATCDFTSATAVSGLSSSGHTPAAPIGSDGFYCWRVKAIDGIGNDSGYTTAFEFRLDTSKPIITATATKADAMPYVADTWTNQSVTVAFTCSDGSGSGLSVNTVTLDNQTLMGETSTGSVTGSGSRCVDNAGNQADSVTFSPIKIDKTAPVITDLGPATSPNGNGWYNTDVTNLFSASDALSGLSAACQSSFPNAPGSRQSKVTTGEGTAVHVTSTSCTDVAGNTATGVDSANFKIDKTAPVITDEGPTTDPNTNSWYNTDVTNEFHVSDALSGVDVSCATNFADAPAYTQFVTSSGEGLAVHVTSASCTDLAGNTAMGADSADFQIDQTAPVISAVATRADSSTYFADTWTNQSVTVDFFCGDGGSGVDDALDATAGDGGTLTTDTSTGSFSSDGSHCVDLAGNPASTVIFSPIKIDTGAPVISAAATNADSSTYLADTWTNQDVTVSFTCSDGTGSGLETDSVASDSDTLTLETSTGSVTSPGAHCVDNAGNEAADVTFSPIKIDKTAPVISDEGPTADPNDAGWYNTDVTNEFHVSDALSGVDSDCATAFAATPAYTQFVTTSGEGASVHVTSDSCTDLAGNTATAKPSADFQIDQTAPTITDHGPTTFPNGAGWYNHDVVNTFSASDLLSGLDAPCLAAFPGLGATQLVSTSTQGTAVHVTSTSCTDVAGNTATGVDSANFKIDKTAPVITDEGPTTDPNTNSWYNTDVTNEFHVSDALSGVDVSCATNFADAPAYTQFVTSSGEGLAVHVTSASCTDLAGNTAMGADSADFQIDQTAPVITTTGPTASPNGAGWYNHDVTNTFRATDALSGVDANCATNFPAAPAYTQSKTTSGEGLAVHVTSDSCTDLAGNTAAAVDSANFKIDKTAPNVHISSPLNASMTIALSRTVTGTVSDGLSDVASVTVNGVSASVSAGTFTALNVALNCGSNTLTALATDVAGNTKTDAITVTRTCFANLQYYQPLDQTASGTPVMNTGKYGRVIPTKVTFKLDDGTTVSDVVAAVRGWTIQIGVNGATCSNGLATDTVEAYGDAGNSNAGSNVFRWSSSQWIYNLDTGAAPGVSMAINGCYRIDVYVSDGTNKVKISTATYALFKPTK